jgi:hypothetical protein
MGGIMSDDMRWEPVFERIVEALREKVSVYTT